MNTISEVNGHISDVDYKGMFYIVRHVARNLKMGRQGRF